MLSPEAPVTCSVPPPPQTADGADSGLLFLKCQKQRLAASQARTGCLHVTFWKPGTFCCSQNGVGGEGWGEGTQFFLHVFLFSASLPRNIYHRNASHTMAGEQGGLRDGFEPKCLLHRLPASWESVTDTGQQLALSGHASVTAFFSELRPGSQTTQSIYPSPDRLHGRSYRLLLTGHTDGVREGPKRNGDLQNELRQGKTVQSFLHPSRILAEALSGLSRQNSISLENSMKSYQTLF